MIWSYKGMTEQRKSAPGSDWRDQDLGIALKQAEPMFSSPVLTYELKGCDALNTQLVRDIQRYRANSLGITRSNRNAWHSDSDVFQREEESFRLFGACVTKIIQAATKQVSPRLDMDRYRLLMSGWVNINGRGGFNIPHDHPKEMWSGCYYVKIPQNRSGMSGDIEFLDPRTSVQAWAVPGSFHFQTRVRKSPQAGLLLLFPSYLRHWVYPNEEEEERISIAFNARLEPIDEVSG